MNILTLRLRHRRLGNGDAEHLQLAVNSRGTPANVLWRHAPNELADFPWDRRTTAAVARFPSSVMANAFAVPTHQGVGLEEILGLETPGPNAVQPDPEEAFTPAETESFSVSHGDHGPVADGARGFPCGAGRGLGAGRPAW